jgi:hypothetical protein
MAAQGKTELDGGIREDGVSRKDEARWRRWSLMVAPSKTESSGRGSEEGSRRRRRGKHRRGHRRGRRCGAKTGVGGIITGHGKEQATPHPHPRPRPRMLLEAPAAHRSRPASMAQPRIGALFSHSRERCWRLSEGASLGVECGVIPYQDSKFSWKLHQLFKYKSCLKG